jgi:signal transduction histidine kinase
VECHAVLEDTLALLGHDLAKRGIAMETQFRAGTDIVMGDRQQLEQVVLNTVMNAGDAMSGGGVIAVTTDDDGGFLQICIADSGSGIPAEVLPNIFDPFVTTKETGTGLGLSIVYGIIADHAGTVDVLNSKDGVTVKIRLPLARQMEDMA